MSGLLRFNLLAGSETGFRNPSEISPANLRLWLDPSDAATISSGGGKITTIRDKSGNESDFSATSPSTRPDYTNQINGLNVITFDQSNDEHLESEDDDNLNGFAAQNATIFAVARATLITGSETAFGWFTAQGDVVRSVWHDSSGAIAYDSQVDGLDIAPGSSFAAGVSKLVTYQLGYTNNTEVYSNTTLVGGPLDLGTPTGTSILVTIGTALFNDGGSPAVSQPFDGDMGEIAMYDTILSNADRLELQNYFIAKWGLT